MTEIKPIRRVISESENKLEYLSVTPENYLEYPELIASINRFGNEYLDEDHPRESLLFLIRVSGAAVKALDELCDKEGNFELDGRKGQVSSAYYGIDVPYRDYLQMGKLDSILIREVIEYSPVKDEDGEEGK